ncbi:hypothetical protein B0H63DRAFT_536576 [Podospora didyma]|uniref:Uncharacterized protein n=1 Tax=Podospora didyma TaxID=330526 RepID=A0AAE0JY74_9PEZI|nr:hypothetical protein B0H63DRAFT_536576 [Podospora didyma]
MDGELLALLERGRVALSPCMALGLTDPVLDLVEYYDFELVHIKKLTRADVQEFFKKYIVHSSPHRAELSVCFEAQAESNVSTKQITELVKTLELDSSTSTQAATDLQARLSAAGHDEAKEIEGLTEDLLHELKVAENKIGASNGSMEEALRTTGRR